MVTISILDIFFKKSSSIPSTDHCPIPWLDDRTVKLTKTISVPTNHCLGQNQPILFNFTKKQNFFKNSSSTPSTDRFPVPSLDDRTVDSMKLISAPAQIPSLFHILPSLSGTAGHGAVFPQLPNHVWVIQE